MMKTKKRFERGLATFLAVCLFMTSFQGVSWAETAEEDYGLEECLVDLDFDQLTDGIEKALQEKKSSDAWRAQFLSPDDSDMASIYQNLFDADSENPLYEVDYKFEEGALPKKAEVQIFVREKAADLYDIQNEGAEAETKAAEAPAAGGGQGTGTPETTAAPETDAPETDAPVEETTTEAPTEETETTAAESETAEEVTTEAPTAQEPETEAPAEVETEADSQNEAEVQISENDVPVVEVALSDIMETVGEEETPAAAEEIESQEETTEAVEEGSEESSEETTEAVDETEESRSETDVEILVPSESETAETASASDAKIDATEAYVITGEEELVFLFKNKSDKDMIFQVRINGFVTEQAYVPSYSTMMDGYQVKDQAPAADPGAAGGGAGGAAGTEETTTAPEEETTADVSLETDETTSVTDETTVGNESETEETTVETEQPATEAPTETEAPATEPEQPATEAPVESGQEETEAEVQVINDEPVAEAPAPQEEAPVAAEPAPQENVPEEAAVAPENSELSASISRNDMPRLMASLDEDVIYEEEQAENGTVGVVLEPVVETTTKTRNVLLFSANSSDTAVTSAAVVPYSAVLLANQVGDGTFRVSLYDYDGAGFEKDSLNEYIKNEIIPRKQTDNKLFMGSHSSYGYQNAWRGTDIGDSGDVSVYQGIAKDSYVNGEIAFNYRTAPLFKPGTVGITPYEVNALNEFFKGEDGGYFVFDSRKQRATYDKNKKELSGAGRYDAAEEKAGGGFWPMNSLTDGKTNTYFGMTISYDFFMPEDGKIQTKNGMDPMIFEFSGDDDVWVYLRKKGTDEGRLALDLGGIHGRSSGSINFESGLITHDSVWVEGIGAKADTKTVYWYLYDDGTEVGQTVEDGKTISKVVGLEREDWAEYTLDFYYMERGGGKSNCYIRCNTPTIPKDKVVVQKAVVGETEADDFEVDLYVDGEFEETLILSKSNQYRAESTSTFLPGTEYYLIETDAKGAASTKWKVGSEESSGITSPTGAIGTNNLAICYNYYDLSPGTHKTAVRQSEEDVYKISLTVDGKSATAEVGDATEETYVDNVTVKDKLTEYVAFERDNVGEPQFWLGDQKLTSTTQNGTTTLKLNNAEVATIDADGIITWLAVTGTAFKTGDSKTLSYLVRVTDSAIYKDVYSEDTANVHKGDSGTGTHADEYGYRSNAEGYAVAKYTTTVSATEKNKDFPHPVVRPKKPAGTLTITKNVDVTGLETTDEETFAKGETFDFTLTIDNISVPEIKVGDASVAVENGTYTRTAADPIQLKDGESLIISGLNKGAVYTITEKEYSNARYSSALSGIVVTENGTVDSETVRNSNTITGTIRAITSSETVEERGYQTSVGVDADDTIQYGSWTNDADESHVTGWYENSVLIPEGDSRFMKTVELEPSVSETIEGTVSEVTNKWTYNGTDYDSAEAVKDRMEDDGLKAVKIEGGVVSGVKHVGVSYFNLSRWRWEFNKGYYKEEELESKLKELGYVIYSSPFGERRYGTPITSKPESLPGTVTWTYDGVNYTDAEKLKAKLKEDGYTTVMQDGNTITYQKEAVIGKERKTNLELYTEGYRHRLYGEKSSGTTNRDANVVVTFTNKFEKKGTITVQKVIIGNPERVEDYKFSLVDANGDKISGDSYSYIVTAEDGTETVNNVDNTDGNFEIKGAGTVGLILDGALQDMAETSGVYIKEEHSDADRINWNRQDQAYGDTSDVVKIGGTVVCENIYFNQTLEIAKNLSADSYSQIPDAYEVFEFEVELPGLAMITYDASASDGVTFATGVVLDAKPGIISLTNGKFTCYIPAGKTLVLTKIPDGASYTVTEKNFKETGTYYDMELVRTEHKTVGDNPAVAVPGTGTTVSKEITGKFNAAVNSSEEHHSITYTNKVTPRYVDIVIQKTLVDSESFEVANEKEDVTINFEITNEDANSLGYGNKFYASITISGAAQAKTESVTIANLPVGKYKVTELPHMRYQLAPDSTNGQVIDTTATLASGETYKAEFKNHKTSNNYFTDTDVIVNGVNGAENGWEFVKKTISTAIFNFTTNANSETSPFAAAEQPIRALVLVEKPKFGEGTYDNGETPLV